MSCKTCDGRQSLSFLEVDQLVAEQLAVEIDLATEAQCQERLQLCFDCPFLMGHTCHKCGCFVKFRAALRFKGCPIKKW
ncbi:hypothetical protein I6N95_10445 [Vagococcus sp. BWB3-3]|uniref:Uncharacterized protein n=1 Tax=Vagococcus allomyrinae TaxID=2794353 RepID=A0A940PAH3_9ENTE|nr:DUF6171 family protein [Vagococcus allomyrinae]MBP1041424.1 hypothetical protein [Vagococcus allomyrinae]